MTSAEVLESICHALGLIDARQWEAFRSYALEPTPAHFRARVNVIAQATELNGMTLLHAVVRCNPPIDLVLDMLEMCPELIGTRDSLGRTPLHVATGSVASPDLIKILAHVCPTACDTQDIDGKTPLHFACDSSRVLFESDITGETMALRQPCHDSIRALLSESIAAVTIEDVTEMCPLEYAIMSNALPKTVKLLQHAAVRYLRGPGVTRSVTLGVPKSTEAEDNSCDVSMREESDRTLI